MKYTILVVDDMPKNIQILGSVLKDEGYDVEYALDGISALEWIQSHKFDAILLDIMMPSMDGFEVCKRIKSDPKTRDIPVIFISAKDDIKDVSKGFSLGAADYITKPFNTREVLVRVATHLKLQRQKAELARLNSLKDKLMSAIAHDLKTPLAIISNMSGLLKKNIASGDSAKTDEALTILNQSIDESFHIINDLLLWSRVQMIGKEILRSRILLNNLLTDVYSAIEPFAREKSISLNSEIPASFSANTDPELLKTVLRNLVINAIKFTPDNGSVTVSAATTDQDHIEIRVTDTGIGIPEAKIRQLFSEGYMDSAKNGNMIVGSGLGLYICKDIIEYLQGGLEVFSNPETGSTIRIILKS